MDKIYQIKQKYSVRDNGKINENTKIIMEKYGVEHFRIKNWKEEKGEKIHPLLKDSPIADLGLRYAEKLKPLEKEIDDVFDKATPEQKHRNFSDEHDAATFLTYSSARPELIQKLMKIFAEDMEIEEFFAFYFIENLVNFTEKPSAPGEYVPQIWPAVAWHEDGQVYNSLRAMVYLNDVDDIEDGAFEYAYPPEKYAIDSDTLQDLDVNIGALTVSFLHKDAPAENKKLFLGKKFSAALFHPHIPHKGNYPTRKSRRVLMFDFQQKGRISKAHEYEKDVGKINPDLYVYKPLRPEEIVDVTYSPAIKDKLK
jgi:hypothetical protein